MAMTLQPAAAAPVFYTKIVSSERMERRGPYRYTEANLIKMLYDNGIGRPSTYASIVNKIKEKGYVLQQSIEGEKVEAIQLTLSEDNVEPFTTTTSVVIGKETNKLILQPVGRAVIEFLIQHFEPLINYDYTNKMETYLDLIVNGEKTLVEVCDLCNTTVHQCMEGVAIITAPPKKIDTSTPNSVFLGGDNRVYVKKGRYGVYFEWTTEKGEKKTKSYKTNRPLDNITLNDAIKVMSRA
jgi:DNA topoisomerase IA